MIGSDVCAQCAAPNAKKRCSVCKSVFYCSIECQKAAWPSHKSTCKEPPLPERDGHGEWDDISEQQVHLSLTDEEASKLSDVSSTATTMLAALTFGINHGRIKCYCNPPRYDRLMVWTTKDSSTYVVEAGLDAWEGAGWWRTIDATEKTLKAQGLVAISADVLKSEFGGVLAFLELCKRVGAPRYTLKTDLDPNAKPHVIAVIERLLGASELRFMLDAAALERADAAAK